jgi:prevent-host-death family protein
LLFASARNFLRDVSIRAILSEKDGMDMRQVNSTDFKNHLGEFLDLARDEALMVRKSGKPLAVVMSAEEYEHLQRLEDAYWLARAQAAETRGQWVGHDEAMRSMTERLKRAE